MRVGFVGLGRMGGPMAGHLVQAGHDVTVFNRSKTAEADLLRAGASSAGSPAEVAARSEVTFTCVTDPVAVQAVYGEPGGILSAEIGGTLLVDHSTVSPELSRQLASAAGARGAQFLDAPVSGGPAGAEAGALSIMAGGAAQAFARGEPVMRAYGARIEHMGPAGAGSATKLANQLLTGVHSAAAAEAVALLTREGIDLAQALDLISVSFGASRMLERNGALMLERNFDGGTAIDLIVKDLRLIRSQATIDGLSLPMGAAAQELFEEAQAEGLGARDLAAILLHIERVTGVRASSAPEGER